MEPNIYSSFRDVEHPDHARSLRQKSRQALEAAIIYRCELSRQKRHWNPPPQPNPKSTQSSRPRSHATRHGRTPSEVSDAFFRSFQRLAPDSRAALLQILQLVAAARRPLKVSELEVASRTQIPLSRREKSQPSANVDCMRLCDGLLKVERSSIVSFCHPGMRKFISSVGFRRHFRLSNADETFAAICIQHLRCGEAAKGAGKATRKHPCPFGGRTPCPFGSYAVAFWKEHYSQPEARSQLLHSLLHQALLSSLPGDGHPRMHCRLLCSHVLVTGLQMAVTQDLVAVARTYLEMGAGIHRCNHSTRTPLHIAASNSSPDMITLLLEQGADPDAFAEYATEAPRPFCTNDDAGVPLALVESNAQHHDCHCWRCCGCISGQTPLHLAAARGRDDVLKHLIAGGANVRLPTKHEGNTALHIAARLGQLLAIQCLIDAGADICARNLAGETPLQLAISGHHYVVAKLIASNSPKTSFQPRVEATYVETENGVDASTSPVWRMQFLSLEDMSPQMPVLRSKQLQDTDRLGNSTSVDTGVNFCGKEPSTEGESWVFIGTPESGS
jgi:ankyrin repeat protein